MSPKQARGKVAASSMESTECIAAQSTASFSNRTPAWSAV